jgi:hypothetical protein
MMEYRFNFTPRLIAFGLCAGLALLVLLFALGFQLGVRMAADPVAPLAVQRAVPAPRGAP